MAIEKCSCHVKKRPWIVGDKNPAKRLEVRKKISLALKGRKHSQEHIQKIKEAVAGKSARYWLGKKRPEMSGNNSPSKRPEVREKMRKSRIGIKLSEETKEKIRQVQFRQSDETRLKKRLAKLGTKHSIESRRKRGIHWMGIKNPNYKHGKWKEWQKHYFNLDYKLWREFCFKRDNYTCQKCGATKTYLTVHHIKSWAKYPDLRYEKSNGITLCEPCHSLTDNYKGRNSKRGKGKVKKITTRAIVGEVI
jgi:5-methylcytosine-specific restriction endonuclease McrA